MCVPVTAVILSYASLSVVLQCIAFSLIAGFDTDKC